MKALIISPTPTHPTNAGNRIRIYTFCELLKQRGFELHFLFIDYEVGDLELMKEYFNGNVYHFKPKHYLKKCGFKDKAKHFWYRKKKRFLKKLKHTFHISDNLKYNHRIDNYYDMILDTYLKENFADAGFTHVLVEYVVYSRALTNFGKDVVKVIDVHDSLTDRYKIYLKNNTIPEFYSLFPNEEAKGLNRADYVIAIQETEKAYFKSISTAQVEAVGHFPDIEKVASDAHKSLLFIGSGNKINIDGINHFIKNIFPSIIEKDSSIKLLIAGNICDSKEIIANHENIELLGRYDDPVATYAKGAVVIVPLTYGTGLKIKTVEALAYGKAVVTFAEGIKGLPVPDSTNEYCLYSENDAIFANQVLSLMEDDELRQRIEDNALNFMMAYNKQNIEAFDRVFS